MAHFIRVENNPLPEGAEVFDFTADDGEILRGARFPVENAKGTFLVLSGWVEFIEKYFETIRDLQARGFSCAMMDWRGQGLSARLSPDRRRSHLDDVATFQSDLKAFFDRAVAAELPGPYYLLAHSMGGLPSLLTLSEGDTRFRAAAFSAPLTKLKGGVLQEIVFRTLANGIVAFGGNGLAVNMPKDDAPTFDEDALTSDPVRFKMFADLQAAEPDACVRAPTFGWLKAVFRASDALHAPERIKAVTIPTLIVSAGLDRLVVSEDHAALAAESDNIRHVLIDEARHEILMERDELRNRFFAELDALVERAG